ncbi:MAG: hypothetical protein ACYSYV_04650 [Planctomycetota bacterium]|jgi:hypothetical protein
MVSRNCLSLFVVTVLCAGSIVAQDGGDLKGKWFDNCLLHEVDGRIWLQKPMVYLGMWGVMATPPFCLSEDLATRFAPLVSNVTSGDKRSAQRFYCSEEVLREQKGHLILVSMKAEIRPVYDEEFKEANRDQMANWPEYYEIVETEMVTLEFVGADWIEAWRTIDEALQDIVTESKTQPGKEKRKRLAPIFDKGERAINNMIQARPSKDFQTLVSKVDPDSRIVQTFARGVTYRWQEWLERFAARLDVKLRSPLPARPKRWVVFKTLAESESLAVFRSAIEKIPPETLEWVYNSEIGRKLRVWETTRPTDEEFERLRAEAKELFPGLWAWEEDLERQPEQSESETIEELGLVLRPASARLLAKKLILSGIEVEKVSDEHKDIGLRAGDIIIDYDRVYDVVMGWHSFSGQTRTLANRMKRGYKLWIIRGNQIINLAAHGKQ